VHRVPSQNLNIEYCGLTHPARDLKSSFTMLVLAVHKLAEASAKVPFSMVVSVLPQLLQIPCAVVSSFLTTSGLLSA
jgi:hypothetical protein